MRPSTLAGRERLSAELPIDTQIPGAHMLLTLFWIAVGIVIGWNVPQPRWPKDLQAKITGALKGRY